VGEHIRQGCGKGKVQERDGKWDDGGNNKGREVGEHIREGYGKGKVRR